MKKNTNKKSKQTRKIAIVVAVAMIIALLAGGTYAFWLWRGNITNLNVTIEVPGIGVTLDGGTTTITGLAPASCKNTTFAQYKSFTVKRFNETNFPAYVVLKLSLDSFTWVNGTTAPSSTALSNIRFAVSSKGYNDMNDTCSDAGVLANNTSSTSVTKEILTYTPQVTINSTNQYYVGSLQGINAGTKNTPVTGQAKKLLTWIYEIPANQGDEDNPISETYYIYYWIDKNYTGVAADPSVYGSGAAGIVDPLQNMSFTVYWSAGGNIIQVPSLTNITSYQGA